jgi:hypothetical protein
MDSWLIKQSKRAEIDADILGASSLQYTVLLQNKRTVGKYQTDFLTFDFTCQLVNGEVCPQGILYGEVLETVLSIK